jgi:hypothetical protein
MSQSPECPNCLKYEIGVPLREEGDSLICPVCESIFSKNIFKINSQPNHYFRKINSSTVSKKTINLPTKFEFT